MNDVKKTWKDLSAHFDRLKSRLREKRCSQCNSEISHKFASITTYKDLDDMEKFTRWEEKGVDKLRKSN